MMRKTLTTATLACAVVVAAAACTTTSTALDRGIVHYREGRYMFAAGDFNEAVRDNPEWATAYVNRGVTRARLGALSAAIDDYNHALELNPHDPAVYFDRGNALVAAGQYGPAIGDFTRAVELSPVFAKAWFNRGSARALAGQLDLAMQDWRHAIDVEGDPWARGAMRRSAGLDGGRALSAVAPPGPGLTIAAVPLPPVVALPTAPAASPVSIDARALAIRAISREVDGDHDGALRDLRAALAAEPDPERHRSLEQLLRKLEAAP
jgi:tetratricopeptide (TPR) repeat protein